MVPVLRKKLESRTQTALGENVTDWREDYSVGVPWFDDGHKIVPELAAYGATPPSMARWRPSSASSMNGTMAEIQGLPPT